MEPEKSTTIRQGNRRKPLLGAAARRFQREGYAASSMRDIAADVGMQVGSIYYHFPSKAELLIAVHEEGLHRIKEGVTRALEGVDGPWQRLEAACVAHLDVLLEGGDFFQAVMREMPREFDPLRERLVKWRDDYEAIFAGLLDDISLPDKVNRHDLRLMLIGAMNWSHSWYRPGAETPRSIARNFVRFLRMGMDKDYAG